MFRWMALPVLALTLAACGGGDDAGGGEAIDSVATTDTLDTTLPESAAATTTTTTTTTIVAPVDGGSATSAPAPTTPTTAAPTPPPSAAAETTVPTPPPTTAAPSADCLIGNWTISEAEMNGFYDTLEQQVGQELSISISGETRLDFTADTYRYTPNFTLSLVVVGQEGTGVTSGSVSGNYSTDGDTIVTTLESSDLDVVVTVMGQTIDGSDMANGALNSFPIVDSPYTCDPHPTIMFKTTDEGVRHPVRLTPA